MKRKALNELRGDKLEALESKAASLAKEALLVSLPSLGQQISSKKARNLRRDIAQIKTIITEIKNKQK